MSFDSSSSDPSVIDALEVLGPLLPMLARRLRVQDDAGFLSDHGLSPRHGTALAVLVRDSLTVGQLAQRLRLSLPTVSSVVSDLDQAGLVERSSDPADRRRTIVTLLEGRRAEAETWLEANVAPVAEVLGALTPSERTAWIRATDLLIERLGPEDPR